MSNLCNNLTAQPMDYIFQVKELSENSQMLQVLLVMLGIGVFVRPCVSAVKAAYLYCPVMLLVGILCGYLLHIYPEFNPYTVELLGTTNANLYLMLFLPVKLFHTAFTMDYHGFGHSTSQVLILTVIGYPIQVVLLGVIFWLAFCYNTNLPVEVACIFSILCFVIESDKVLLELNRTQARVKYVQLLLQGEQLATMAVAASVFFVAFEYYFGTVSGWDKYVVIVSWHICGALLGVILGYALGYLFVHCSYDMIAAVSLTTFAAFFSFFIGHIYICQAGVITTIVTGVLLSPAKIKSTSDIESHLAVFWDWADFIINTLSFLISGMLIGVDHTFITGYYFIIAVILHVFSYICRSLICICTRPLLLRVGHVLTWENLIVIVIGPYRANAALILAMLYRQYSPNHGHLVLTLIEFICLLSSVLNGLSLPYVLRLLGMYDLTHARAMNMQHAIAHVVNCRNKAIHSLKMDRVVADANWLIVEESTKLDKQIQGKKNEHHGSVMERQQEKYNQEALEVHRAICADCGLENEVPPTKRELEDLEIEGRHRIIKAELVSLWRQFENGTLSKRSVRILSTLLQNAMEKEVPWLVVTDLELYWTPPWYMRKLKTVIETLLRTLPKKFEHGPSERWKAVLFRLHSKLVFKFCTTLLILVDTYFILNLALYEHWNKGVSIPPNILQGFDFFIYVLFLVELSLKVLCFGADKYFERFFHKIDFTCNFVLRTTEILMVIHMYAYNGANTPLTQGNFSLKVAKLLLLFRLNRLHVLLEMGAWKLLHIMEVGLDNTLVHYYDIGKAFLIANDRTLKYLRHIVQDKTVYKKLRRELEEDRKRVAKSIGIIQTQRPNVAVSIKTQHAIRNVINEMSNSINSIYDEGLLDEIEKKYLKVSLEGTKKTFRLLECVTPCSPEEILRNVPWLHGEENSAMYLLSHARIHSYFNEEVILSSGDDPFGLFVIVSGLVKVIYKPSWDSIENCRKYGALPNCDFRVSLKLEDTQEDYVVGGNVIGEIGAVTGRQFDMTVICQSEVQVYYIPWACLWTALFDMNNSIILFSKVWKAIGIRIALLLLQYVPNFQGWLREKTLLYLERSFVPNLWGVDELYLNELISDVILIEGMVMDGNSRTIFFAPYYIPRTTNKLIFPGTSKWSIDPKYDTRVLIVPINHADEAEITSWFYKELRGDCTKPSRADELSVHSGTSLSTYMRGTTIPSQRLKTLSDDEKARSLFQRNFIRQLMKPPSADDDSTETFSTESDIPLMKIFQTHVKTAVRQKPDHRINRQNEFNIIDDISEQSDLKEEEDMANYNEYEKLLKKKIKRKIMKRKQNKQDVQIQTEINAKISEDNFSNE